MATILYCEDHPIMNKILYELLKTDLPSHTIISTMSLEQAIEQAHKNIQTINVLLTDGRLGKDAQNKEVFGWDLLQRMQEIGYQGYAILLTTLEKDDIPSNPVFNAVLSKFEPYHKVRETVARYLLNG